VAEFSATSRRWLPLGLGALLSLLLLSVFLGWNRIIQVDEALNVMMARLIGLHRTDAFMATAPLMLLGPVTWLARGATTSSELFHQVRMLFVALMWVNVLLLVKASGVRLRSMEGLLLLLLAATLEPMWDYGFEIRHDNLLLTCLLLFWLLLRPPGRPIRGAFFLAGAVAVLMQLVAFKSFLYSIPLMGFFLLFPTEVEPIRSRGRVLAEALAGAIFGLFLGWLSHRLAGTWPLFLESFKGEARYSVSGVERFAPWDTLVRLLRETPLLVGGAGAVLAAPFLRRKGGLRGLLTRLRTNPHAPEWALLLVCLGAFLANPTPFPYNLVLLVPAMFIAVFRQRASLVEGIRSFPMGWLLWPILFAGHLLPWLTSTPRHLDMSNERQMRVASLAEQLTDPAHHRIFDGSGLVPTRDPIGYNWLIHSFTIRPLSDGTWASIRSELASHEVPVILPSYRTGWLSAPDKGFISSNYLALAQDFLVLGSRMEKGEGQWTALATGNYFLRNLGEGEAWVDVDGRRVQPGSIVLSRGPHRFRFPAQQSLIVIWSGPRGGPPPVLEPARRPLFVNWY
jgi:hypothetical protein